MPHIRRATLADARLITSHRHQMFAANGFASEDRLCAMDAAFEPWLCRHLAAGTYIGLLLTESEADADGPCPDAETDAGTLAGAGIFLQEFPPHWMHDEALRAYLLNFYTAPAARGRGYAPLLLRAAIAEARRHGATIVSLHASPMGRPIYERFGFADSPEMLLRGEPLGVPTSV